MKLRWTPRQSVSLLVPLTLGLASLAMAGSSGAAQIPGSSRYDSVSAPNSSGDLFAGGTWCNASGGSAWVEREFDGAYLVDQIAIGKAGTDVTTEGAEITIKLRMDGGQWIVVDRVEGTNVNWPGVGRSIPSYTRRLSPAVAATAFRLELRGHGWFIASDVSLSGRRANGPVAATPAGDGHWEYVGIDNAVDAYDPAGCYPDQLQGGAGGAQVTISKTCGETLPRSRYSVEWGAPAATLVPGTALDFKAQVTLAENRQPDWTLPVALIGKFLPYGDGPGTASNYSTPPIGPQGNPHPSGEKFTFDNRAQPTPFEVPGHGIADAQGRMKFVVLVRSSSQFVWSYVYRWVERR